MFGTFCGFSGGVISDGEGQAPPDGVADEDKEPGEEKSTVLDNWDSASTLVAGAATATTHREEKKEQQTTIKTLLPVIRSPSHAPEISATERSAFSKSVFLLYVIPLRIM
jgi:hypothetical protein